MFLIELVNSRFPTAKLVIYHSNTKLPQADDTKRKRNRLISQRFRLLL